MKTVNIRVGVKGIPAITVPGRAGENLEDIQTLSRGKLEVLIRCFNRGWRIECQERSGARDEVREKGSAAQGHPDLLAALTAEVGKLVAGYDPTVVHPRVGGPRKPVEIKLAKGKKSYTPDEMAALLAQHGVKATLVAAE